MSVAHLGAAALKGSDKYDLRAVLFDLDGTLIDTQELILASSRYAFTTVLGAKSVPSDAKLSSLIGIPLDTQFEELAPDHAKELAAIYREHNSRTHDQAVREFQGITEALTNLREKGMILAVVTSKRHALAWHGLELFDLTRYFEFLLGADDCKLHKPDPAPLLLAAKRLDVKPEQCAYVGDSPYDMRAANDASMLAIGVLWGMFPEECLLQAGAQYVASKPNDLCKLLDFCKKTL